VLAVAAGVAAAELVAATLGRPQAGTLVAVGAVLVDAAPTPVKEFAVATLGTADKPVLLAGIGVVLALLAGVLGVAAHRNRRVGLAGAAALGVVGAGAALTRPAAAPVDALPSLVGALVVGAALLLLLRSLRSRPLPTGGEGMDRRAFVVAAALVAAGTAATGGIAALLRRSVETARLRAAVRLPAPADPAPPLPAVDPGFLTGNADFYRVDTALAVPQVDLDSWRLTVGGMVDRPVELTFADVLARPLVERVVTLNCVSNEVGGPYIGTASWLGVPLVPLLREVGVRQDADQLIARSVDGMTIGTPVAAVFDGREPLLCVGMNGEPLPTEHGFPLRMLTPGLYGYVGACKWLTELELTTFAAVDSYWTARGWSPDGPVKTASRIDRPAPFAQLGPGTVPVAGVAWAQGRGISAVEVRVDDGPWRRAALRPVPSVNTWVQWRYDWAASPGSHTLRVRATDGTGAIQPEERTPPFPDGATGWHSVVVTVS
jgi:DMSO/TMAO reductase YedYZ molybdopterin-dependent catalytic subunit